MSCSTLNQSSVRMEVSAGALPEGFCPESMQDLFNAMATRLIVTPNQNFTSFAAGSVAPTSNVGPWFKDCEQWFIWDDATAAYIPMTKGGFDNQLFFTGSTTFQVPAFIYKLKVTAWGAGGGGSDSAAGVNGSGGGGGGFASKIIDVIPFENIVMVIGAGGANGANGANGGVTTVSDDAGIFVTGNGGIGAIGVTSTGGLGGTATGGDVNMSGQAGWGISNTAGGVGGDAGGWGGKGGTLNTLAAARAGLVPGGGGSGGQGGFVTTTGGAGAGGGVSIEW